MHARYAAQQEVGVLGERAAARWYAEQGYTVLGQRERVAAGEIDAVVEDEDGTIVFVEVKSRRGGAFGAAEAVTAKKLRTMRRCAAQWMREHPALGVRAIRFDVVECVTDGDDFVLRRYLGVEDAAC